MIAMGADPHPCDELHGGEVMVVDLPCFLPMTAPLACGHPTLALQLYARVSDSVVHAATRLYRRDSSYSLALSPYTCMGHDDIRSNFTKVRLVTA